MTNDAIRVDALCQPIVPDSLYYIEDRSVVVGDCMLWWAPNSRGYTCSLDKAGVYKGDWVARLHRDTDVPWPQDFVDARTARHARRDVLWGDARAAPKTGGGAGSVHRLLDRALGAVAVDGVLVTVLEAPPAPRGKSSLGATSGKPSDNRRGCVHNERGSHACADIGCKCNALKHQTGACQCHLRAMQEDAAAHTPATPAPETPSEAVDDEPVEPASLDNDAHAALLLNLPDAPDDEPSARPVETPSDGPVCASCGKPATCLGLYEVCEGPEQYACDDCCGHGNEDGHCNPVEPKSAGGGS